MKLVMAVSADGYVTRRGNDNMSWLGPWDKAAFRLITGVGGVLGCGARTWLNMPAKLEGRLLCPIRSNEALANTPPAETLMGFQTKYPDGWLIGGQHIATNALSMGLISEAHICRSDRRVDQHTGPGDDPTMCTLGISFRYADLHKRMSTRVGDTTIEVWRRGT